MILTRSAISDWRCSPGAGSVKRPRVWNKRSVCGPTMPAPITLWVWRWHASKSLLAPSRSCGPLSAWSPGTPRTAGTWLASKVVYKAAVSFRSLPMALRILFLTLIYMSLATALKASQASAADEKEKNVSLAKGVGLLEEKRYPEARQEFLDATRRHPGSAEAFFYLGVA